MMVLGSEAYLIDISLVAFSTSNLSFAILVNTWEIDEGEIGAMLREDFEDNRVVNNPFGTTNFGSELVDFVMNELEIIVLLRTFIREDSIWLEISLAFRDMIKPQFKRSSGDSTLSSW
eukprot:CAMPEP_0114580470 /NCGR_PEP_ID=MMETSP0125-20121206/4748_1 /TAXON_ID=485358 ORGANISM="Aristerostoma sp., Strain ATCC 50986" /NCGR_SAMPLE_ID=MMETSP0125 /ASSEMBLY_ACC=CAM_ASM_000245 /LENGTH=117 /DNA_ID=CAMNT_0001772049 /DNA_START=1660 /DNA_END=2012 /DNA_ORIENTATION=+